MNYEYGMINSSIVNIRVQAMNSVYCVVSIAWQDRKTHINKIKKSDWQTVLCTVHRLYHRLQIFGIRSIVYRARFRARCLVFRVSGLGLGFPGTGTSRHQTLDKGKGTRKFWLLTRKFCSTKSQTVFDLFVIKMKVPLVLVLVSVLVLVPEFQSVIPNSQTFTYYSSCSHLRPKTIVSGEGLAPIVSAFSRLILVDGTVL